MNRTRPGNHRVQTRQGGMTLIELMVGMVIGLLVSGAAITMTLATSRTHDVIDSLGRIQENARIAFELVSRDLREAGGNPCARNVPVANVLTNAGTAWWASFNVPVRGYEGTEAFPDAAFGTAAGERVSGTDAIELKSGRDTGYSVETHTATSANFKINSAGHDIRAGDIVMVCDFRQASIMQVTNADTATATIVHNQGTGTPGNCSKGLGFKVPMDCSANGTAYTYGANSQVTRLRAVRWYVGNNGRGGRSLYQSSLRNSGTSTGVFNEEVLEGVTDLQIEYLLAGSNAFVASTSVAADQWRNVVSVRLTVQMAGAQGNDAARYRVGTDGEGLRRSFSHVIALRNRMS
jgi:type IV pilus assembly protein PilW